MSRSITLSVVTWNMLDDRCFCHSYPLSYGLELTFGIAMIDLLSFGLWISGYHLEWQRSQALTPDWGTLERNVPYILIFVSDLGPRPVNYLRLSLFSRQFEISCNTHLGSVFRSVPSVTATASGVFSVLWAQNKKQVWNISGNIRETCSFACSSVSTI